MKWLTFIYNALCFSGRSIYQNHKLLTVDVVNANKKLIYFLNLNDQYHQEKDENNKLSIRKNMSTVREEVKSIFQNSYIQYITDLNNIAEAASVVADQQKCTYINNHFNLDPILKFIDISIAAAKRIYYIDNLNLNNLCENIRIQINNISKVLPSFYRDNDSHNPKKQKSCEFKTAKKFQKIWQFDLDDRCGSILSIKSTDR